LKIKGPSGKNLKEEIMKPETVFSKADVIVTIGCIVFLLATIGAVGPGGQRHAKEMLCLSQLHKWGDIFQDYLNDNGGYFMKGYIYDDNYASDMWMDALRPYYKKGQMRVCPEATVPSSEIGGGEYGGGGVFAAWGVFTLSWGPVILGDYGSYGMNGWAYNSPSDSPWGLPPYYWWRVAHVAGGDNIPLFLDCQWIDGWPQYTDDPPEFDGQPWDSVNQMRRFCMNRHRGYINSLFLDGSARKVGLKELWTLKWHREFDTCGMWTVCGGVQPNDWPEWMRDFEDY
jgi:prepilin-type processing-associated H-X9-DG protein